MNKYRILAGFIVIFFVALLSLSTAAHAARGEDDDSGSGSGHKKGKKLPKHARVLQAQINDNKASIENIQLTPGPQGEQGSQGDKGDTGATGAQGPQGDPGEDGLSIQGPPGESGTSRWFDGFDTVSTTGSVQIGNDEEDCTSANEGTIRFNPLAKLIEVCNGTEWHIVNMTPTPEKLDADGDGFYTDAYYSVVDCDDNNYYVNPDATEIIYDGIDNDCDPSTPDGVDADNDGWDSDVDCDDYDEFINPGVAEIRNDGIDNDCNELTEDTSYYVGQEGPAGGIVIYTTNPNGGMHGMEAAPANAGSGIWGCSGTFIGGTAHGYGKGRANTQAILGGCSTAGIAARIADDYVYNGYDDWFLPSRVELQLLLKPEAAVPRLGKKIYWSSTEATYERAYYNGPLHGSSHAVKSLYLVYVRPVREF